MQLNCQKKEFTGEGLQWGQCSICTENDDNITSTKPDGTIADRLALTNCMHIFCLSDILAFRNHHGITKCPNCREGIRCILVCERTYPNSDLENQKEKILMKICGIERFDKTFYEKMQCSVFRCKKYALSNCNFCNKPNTQFCRVHCQSPFMDILMNIDNCIFHCGCEVKVTQIRMDITKISSWSKLMALNGSDRKYFYEQINMLIQKATMTDAIERKIKYYQVCLLYSNKELKYVNRHIRQEHPYEAISCKIAKVICKGQIAFEKPKNQKKQKCAGVQASKSFQKRILDDEDMSGDFESDYEEREEQVQEEQPQKKPFIMKQSEEDKSSNNNEEKDISGEDNLDEMNKTESNSKSTSTEMEKEQKQQKTPNIFGPMSIPNSNTIITN